MEYKSFAQLTDKVKGFAALKRMAVAVAGEEHTLEAALHARKERLADPVLVGDREKILAILSNLGESVPQEDIYDERDETAACALAVSLVREGKADFLMKGMVDTKVILKAVVNKESGLGTGGTMSHMSLYEAPGYHKLFAVTDGGMVPYPTLEQKRDIIANAVGIFHGLGYQAPKVGVLCCVEKVNPKMPETVEAAELAEQNRTGAIGGCTVAGPISYDCAMSKEVCAIKGYQGAVGGDADILVAPNIHAGNIMGKMLTCTAGAKMAGIIVGAKCPIVLTSRGSTAEEKYLSIALCAATS